MQVPHINQPIKDRIAAPWSLGSAPANSCKDMYERLTSAKSSLSRGSSVNRVSQGMPTRESFAADNKLQPFVIHTILWYPTVTS
jgi:hypothetical protein